MTDMVSTPPAYYKFECEECEKPFSPWDLRFDMILDLDYPPINLSAAKDVDSVSIRPENRVEYS